MAHRDHPDDSSTTFLAHLADGLCQGLADNNSGVLVHVKAGDDGADVGFLDLEGRPPADVLLGSVAPEDWVAVGVATRGWAHPLEHDRSQGQAGAGRSGPIDVVVLVHRCGEVVGRLRMGDTVMHEPPAYGATLDCLQRALGLPTAAPLLPTGHLFACTWLETVLAAAIEQRLTWAGVGALHPATQLLAADPSGVAAGRLVAAAGALERVCDWERLRWLVVEGRWLERSLTPTEAAWFDEGGFSRWVMGQRMSLDQLLDQVARATKPGVARRCAAVLHQLGIPCRGRGLTAA